MFKRGAGLLLLMAAGVAAYWGWRYWQEQRFDQAILAASRRYRVDPALVKAVIWRESRFNPEAHGRAGELGLMQIRAVAANEWAASEHLTSFDHQSCLDAATNTMAGAWYLKKTLNRYRATDNPAAYALADYNAGRANLLKWNQGAGATNSAAFIQQIEFPGTKKYVQAILGRTERYRQSFEMTNGVRNK